MLPSISPQTALAPIHAERFCLTTLARRLSRLDFLWRHAWRHILQSALRLVFFS